MPHGQRYGRRCHPDFLAFARQIPHASFRKAIACYEIVLAEGCTTDELAYLACNDRFFLLTQILRRPDAIHPWLYARLREVEASPDGYLDLWARYHYKSTAITFAGSIQEIARDPDITIAIFSITKDVAAKFGRQIMREIEENPLLSALFPDVFPAVPKDEAPLWSRDMGVTVFRSQNPKEPTLSWYGLLDALPTGSHFKLRIYDDVITERVTTMTDTDQIKRITTQWELSQNLGTLDSNRMQHAGTRYCSRGDMRVLMADWSHKAISDVRVGDVVVGWEMRDGKRYLRPAAVKDRGMHQAQPVNRYVMENGREVVVTEDHRWWRGAHGGGPEYAPLGFPAGKRADRPPAGMRAHGKLVALRQLLVPTERLETHDAGWFAGFFDGEGTMWLNKGENRASGRVCLTQTMANPTLIEQVRVVLTRLGFSWTESWVKAAGRDRMTSDRCVFGITGGWRERYRFLAEIGPTKRSKLAATLFAQLTTDRVALDRIEPAGVADVHWLETETGNYVIEGFCSSNSYADSYGVMIAEGMLKVRLYPATHNGRIDGRPVLMTQEKWDEQKVLQKSQIAAQMLQNPLATNAATFTVAHLRPYLLRPRIINVYILGDPSKGTGKRSDRTALIVLGYDAKRNVYLLDGMLHRMRQSERWANLKALHQKWKKEPGVAHVRVGYERYGMQTDLEYFEERMVAEDIPMDLVEVSWTRDGTVSKGDRIGRLEPLFRNSRFWFPRKVWRPIDGNCIWKAKPNDPAEKDSAWAIHYTPLITQDTKAAVTALYADPDIDPEDRERRLVNMTLLKEEREAIEAGEGHLVIQPIKRMNEDRQPYDLTTELFLEFSMHPFSPHDDGLDATSRIFDVDPTPPLLPQAYRDLVPMALE